MRVFGGEGGGRASSGTNHAAISVPTGKATLGHKADQKMSTEFRAIQIFSDAIFLPYPKS